MESLNSGIKGFPPNRIREIIKSKETRHFKWKVDNAWYREIRISKKRFAQILKNEVAMDTREMATIAKELGVGIQELLHSEEPTTGQ